MRENFSKGVIHAPEQDIEQLPEADDQINDECG